MKARLRVRMGSHDAHYGGALVDGARILGLFGDVATELCTPTGAAILAATVTQWTAAPVARPVAVGWGAGDLDLADRPNVLRLVLLAPAAGTAQSVWQIDANIDDMSPELTGAATDAIFAAGAVDVWWTPINMKKGRPALTLSAVTALLLASGFSPAFAVLPLMALIGLGVGVAGPSRDLLVRRAATAQFGATAYGRVYGFVYSGLDTGQALSPVLFGPLLDAGHFRQALFAVAALQASGLFFALHVGSRVQAPAPLASAATQP